MSTKKKKAELKILEEIKNQLLLQSERFGRTGFYTPLKLEEMRLEECKKIIGEFYSEKANLEYELQMLDSDSRESIIKLERLENYTKRAEGVARKHDRVIKRLLGKLVGDKEKTKKAVNYIEKRKGISVLLGDKN